MGGGLYRKISLFADRAYNVLNLMKPGNLS